MSVEFTETYSHILFDGAAAEPEHGSVEEHKPVVESLAPEPVEVPKAEGSAEYKRLVEEVVHTTFEYVPVEMPCQVHTDGTISFAEPADAVSRRSFRFSTMGLGYLGERFQSLKSGEWVAMHREGNFSLMQSALNGDPAAQPDGASRRFILAIKDGVVVGTPKRYIPVEHGRLLGAVEAAGLASAVESGYVSDRELGLNVRQSYVMNAERKEVASVGLRLSNGHSGHSALRFYAYCTAGEHYEYAVLLGKGRSRHLGKVMELVGDIEAMEKAAAAINFEWALKSLVTELGATVAKVVEGKKHEADIIRLAVESPNGLSLFEGLIALVDNRDYRVAARAALNALMDRALSTAK